MRKYAAEVVGTFILTFFGCGSAVAATAMGEVGNAGLVGISLVFGMTLVAGIAALGPISGGHFNPAVTAGLTVSGRSPVGDLVPYWVSQCVGASLAALALSLVLAGRGDALGLGETIPTPQYGQRVALGYEVLLTAVFLISIIGSVSNKGLGNLAPVTIGATLAMIIFVGGPFGGPSVNPARSIGPALFSKNALALSSLWIYLVGPLAGGVVGGVIGRALWGSGQASSS